MVSNYLRTIVSIHTASHCKEFNRNLINHKNRKYGSSINIFFNKNIDSGGIEIDIAEKQK